MPEGAALKPIGVVHYGLGPIGRQVARFVGTSRRLRSVSAIDVSPAILGLDLAKIVDSGATPCGVTVTDAATGFANGKGEVVAHCTGSSLAQVLPQILDCLAARLNVVSTCEELSYPWVRQPELARTIDEAAKTAGVSVLGTGVNPGFAMDYLPLVLTGAARRVEHIRVRRVQDAGQRRLPLQQKIGAGLDVAEFRRRAKAGTVRHVGLPESAQALAAALGWELTGLHDVIEPIVAEKSTPAGFGEIAGGHVLGVRQFVIGSVGNREVLSLTLEMAVGLAEPRDEIEIRGEPDIRMVIPGGLHGDVATAAVVANALPRVVAAPLGLLVMTDLPPPHP